MLTSRSFIGLIFLVACGGKVDGGLDASPGDAAPTVDASPSNDASPPPPPMSDASPGQCNDLEIAGDPVTIEEIAESAPPFASTGGSLADGLYQLQSLTVYTGPNGSSGTLGNLAARLRVTTGKGGWLLDVVSLASGDQSEQRSTNDATLAGTGTLDLTQTCPTTEQAVSAFYAFDGATFTLRVTSNGAVADETLVLVTK